MSPEPERFLPVSAPVIGERELAYVTDAVRSGWVSSIGPYIERLEAAFAAHTGVRHAIAVSNGTAALHLALHALGVGPGDEVIVPDLTFVATAHAVLLTGATPVFADVESDTWCVDPRAVARALSARTRAIIPVHAYGHPADMSALRALAAPRRIALVEDAAEAHGAELDGRRAGALGDAGTFSFYGNKLVTTGEGGMVVTADDELAARLRFLKDHGMSKSRRYYHTELAFNYRLTNLQAALGLAQLEQLDGFVAKKRLVMDWYRERLRARPELVLNAERPGCKSAFWMASVVLPAGVDRDRVAGALRAQGIDTRPFFVPMSELPHLEGHRRVGAREDGCPVAAELSRRGLNLPSGCGLGEDDVDRVARGLLAAIDREPAR